MSILVHTALLALAAAPQAPPCLSSFQRVTVASPTSGGRARIEVDGNLALVIAPFDTPTGLTNAIQALERQPDPLGWVVVQLLQLDGLGYGGFQLEGERAIIGRRIGGLPPEVLVLERDSSTGLWNPTFAIPVPSTGSGLARIRLAGDRIAMGLPWLDQIDIWRRTPAGTWSFEDTIEPPDPSTLNFAEEFDFFGERLVQNGRGRLDGYRVDANGNWSLEVESPASGGYGVNGWFEPPFLDGRGGSLRAAQAVFFNSGPLNAMGYWRFSTDLSPNRAIFDGALDESLFGNEYGGTTDGTFAAGTFIDRLEHPTCGTLDPTYLPIVVVGLGERDDPALSGLICRLGGFAGAGDVVDIDYDGRTLACSVRRAAGAPAHQIHFADLLGADLDRNANCIADADEIAVLPALDRNTNGRLDGFERRGTRTCEPTAPNSTGRPGHLDIIGTEFAGSPDLVARLENLPPQSFAVLLVARATSPASGPLGPFGLCLGTGPIGRYAPTPTDAAGVAIVPLLTAALPLPLGAVTALPGETWSWQAIYRDGAAVGTTATVHVELH